MTRALPVGLAALLIVTPAAAQPAPAAEMAFLYGYRIRPGQESGFADGYRRHLEWHRERRDSLPWLGWTVAAGPASELDLFVDGTFGIRGRAFDQRVDPRGDAADGAANVTAFAEPVFREAYRLRADLSSARRLEERRAGAFQKVIRIELTPAGLGSLEAALRSWRPTGAADYAVYQRVAGGPEPGVLVVIQLAAWADLETPGRDPSAALLGRAGSAIRNATSTVWVYRADLSYLP